MKLNRKWMLVIALMLSIAVATGGTLAYLSDTDADVNTMTLGSVYIVQNEQERAEDGTLRPFTNNTQVAYPAVGPIEWADKGVDVNGTEYKVFTDKLKNVIDKIVTVTNTGKSDAYVRTIIAIEAPDGDPNDLIHVNYNGDDGLVWGTPVLTEIDGVDYFVMSVTYKEALAPKATSVPSLVQLFLDSAATNEDVAKFGDTWDVIVLSQAMQTAGFDNAVAALDEGFGALTAVDAATGKQNVVVWLEGASNDIGSPSDQEGPDKNPDNNPPVFMEHWDGTADTSWYNDTDTEFEITTCEQLAGLSKLVDDGKTFAGKTVKLGNDLCLNCDVCEKDAALCFNPIGSYRKNLVFEGTFDGQNHTIKNLSQNTWALDTGYEYGDLGLGLFGKLQDATVKNLVMDGASISGESAICGTVAAAAYGDCTFDHITIKNSKVADYLYYAGGVVGWASGDHQYTNINVEESVVVGGQWGDFGNANGGVIGGTGASATIRIKDSTVACRIDAVNDVVSAYQWYNYRNSGMLVGRTGTPEIKQNEVTNATAPNLTCENVTVIYGDWANYTYCEFAGTGYPYVRVQAGTSVDAYSNVRYGHPTDANGNTVVDDNHTHNDGEAHHKLIAFDQIYGGPADHRYCYYGVATHPGVKVVYNNK